MPATYDQDIAAYSAAGFEAMEIWLAKVDAYLEKGNSLEDARRLMADSGLEPAGACFVSLTFSGDRQEEESLQTLRRRLEMCQALGARTLVVIPGVPGTPVTEQMYERAAEGLARCAEMAEPYDVSLAIEFIKGAPLIGSVRTAAAVARKSARPNVGVLFDTLTRFISTPASPSWKTSSSSAATSSCSCTSTTAATYTARWLPTACGFSRARGSFRSGGSSAP